MWSYSRIKFFCLFYTSSEFRDEVVVELTTELAVNSVGSPKHSEWTTLAFTSSAFQGQGDDQTIGSSVMDNDEAHDSYEDESKETDDSCKSKADFMRLILGTQMMDIQKIEHDVEIRYDFLQT